MIADTLPAPSETSPCKATRSHRRAQPRLTIELTAINQYFCQAKMCKNWGFMKLAAKHYEESIGEMKHADKIIERDPVPRGHARDRPVRRDPRRHQREGAVRERPEARDRRREGLQRAGRPVHQA